MNFNVGTTAAVADAVSLSHSFRSRVKMLVKSHLNVKIQMWGNPRISYRNGWNTEAMIFENLKLVEITKKLFQHHLNTLKKV